MIQILSNKWNEIEKVKKVAFLTAVFVGIVVHLYMLTNKLPNHDDLNQFYMVMDRTTSGRWFLEYPTGWSGRLSIPFAGILSIIYIALSAFVCVSVLKIKSWICAGIIGAIMVVFPSITTTMSYMNNVDGYTFALLLACIGVYFSEGRVWQWLCAVVALTLSLGIYQAYFPFAVALLVLLHIQKCLDATCTNKDIIISGLKSIGILICSLLAYMGIVKVTTAGGAELTSYQGINEMGKISLNQIPTLISKAYENSLGFYTENLRSLHYTLQDKLFIVSFIVALAGVIYLLKKLVCEQKIVRVLIVVLACGILPFAAGFIYIMVQNNIHMLMVYGFISLLIFPIMILDRVSEARKDAIVSGKLQPYLMNCAEALILIMCMTTFTNYTIRANQYYFTLNMAYEQSYAYASTLMTKITGLEGYSNDKKIVLIGAPQNNTDVRMPWLSGVNPLKDMTGYVTQFASLYSYKSFLNYYMGAENEIINVRNIEELQNYIDFETFYVMDIYPDSDAICIINDLIIVKFKELL